LARWKKTTRRGKVKIEKIDRVVFAVKSVKEAANFLEKTLGIKFDEHVDAKDLNIRVKYSSLGIQLNEGTTPESDVNKFLNRHGEGFYCLALKVPDIEEAKKELISKGVRHLRDFQVGQLKESVFNPKDSHGMMIVLVEYPTYHGATVAALEYGPKS
jgi:4-hydroxyphenylpyruvate dioxygenase-like putative hemolysin